MPEAQYSSPDVDGCSELNGNVLTRKYLYLIQQFFVRRTIGEKINIITVRENKKKNKPQAHLFVTST